MPQDLEGNHTNNSGGGRRSPRRKKNYAQQYIMLGAFLLAAVLLVACVVMIIKAASSSKPKTENSSSPSVSASVNAVPSSAVEIGGQGVGAAKAGEWNMMIVSPLQPLATEYQPELTNIVRVVEGGSAVYKVDSRIADPLNNMMAACNAEGNNLNMVSGWRGFTSQTKEHNYYVKVYHGDGQQAGWYEPPAGQSEHHTGLSVDFISGNGNTQQTDLDFANSPEYAWLIAHAHEYGFILRYPEGKGDITGQAFQPYHWRFVGVEEATQMRELGVVLEEYVYTGDAPPAVPVPEEEAV